MTDIVEYNTGTTQDGYIYRGRLEGYQRRLNPISRNDVVSNCFHPLLTFPSCWTTSPSLLTDWRWWRHWSKHIFGLISSQRSFTLQEENIFLFWLIIDLAVEKILCILFHITTHPRKTAINGIWWFIFCLTAGRGLPSFSNWSLCKSGKWDFERTCEAKIIQRKSC